MPEKIVYEQHPVSAERKAELRQKGYKIIDARFAPDGYEHPEPLKEAKGSKTGKSAAEKKAAEEAELKAKLQAALNEKGVQFSPEASAEDLQKLLDEAK
ncbi:hypothetical protein N7650_21480 [Pseudomonas sp. GD04058]|uniref:hypothetical protein n=1 Tax=Pseudomonas sp. GD04058 TaxID=2975429 RepID=UPI00244D4C7A|nr:hypothetical protein [Pseudomonas sp. GD04058]MDG9885414.1 hypothetical protein [Pseudomonas sp. GD04058]